MNQNPVARLVEKADRAIKEEDFDALMDIYAEDAILVVKPGVQAVGKNQIKQACEAIAAHFEHSLEIKQAGMEILEAGDTALVLAKTLVSAKNHPVTERKATYVFKKNQSNDWVCVIDNSYGHDLLEANA